jgi:hypothetical protein
VVPYNANCAQNIALSNKSQDWRWFAGWLCLSCAAVAMLFGVRALPFYDYYEWLFQGNLVAQLLFGVPGAGESADNLYGLRPVPVPNLGAPLLIGLLNVALPIELAGRLFVAVTVLAFAYAFAYLVRAVQGRPTVIEFAGFLFGFGFFLYKGYLSYLFGLSLALIILGKIHKLAARSDGAPNRPALSYLALMGMALYLSHMMAWSVAVLATLLYSFALFQRQQHRPAALLVLTLLPGVLLLIWYTLAERSGIGVSAYDSWKDKADALLEPLQLFVRLEPFPQSFPIFWANLGFGLALLALLLPNVDRTALRTALRDRPVLWLGGLLAATALLLPIEHLNGLNRPDGRLVLPAFLAIVAALPYRAFRAGRGTLVIGLVALCFGLHIVEYSAIGSRIRRVDAVTHATIPTGSPILHVAIQSGSGCTPAFGPSVGVNTLKWFVVDYALESGQARLNFDETSFVHSRFDKNSPGVTVLAPDPKDIAAEIRPPLQAYPYPYVQAIGCPKDLATVELTLASHYDPIRRSDGITILRRRD